MSIVFFIGLYALAATLVLVVMHAKNAAVPPSVWRMEDEEQMAAVGRGLGMRPADRDPYATLS